MNGNRRCPGVLFVGRKNFTGRYATIMNNYLLAMDRANIRYTAIDSLTGKLVDNNGERQGIWDEEKKIFRSSENLAVIVNESPTDFDKIKVNGRCRLIGAALFETHSFPMEWLNYIDLVDEIWVPSSFNLETFNKAGIPAEKLRIVPYGIDTDFFGTANVEPYRIQALREFVFLHILSNSQVRRRGYGDVGMLLRAYYRAFQDKKNTTLLLKLMCKSPVDLNRIKASVQPEFNFDDPGLPHVEIIQDKFTNEEMRQLYRLCDVYVASERAKGWDFPAMEAMAMGKPVVGIHWGGRTEFLNYANAFLIPHRANLINIDEYPDANQLLYSYQLLPDVRDVDVEKALIRAYTEKDLQSQLSSRAQKEIREKYSLEIIGRRIKEILNSYDTSMMRGKEAPCVQVLPFSFVKNELLLKEKKYLIELQGLLIKQKSRNILQKEALIKKQNQNIQQKEALIKKQNQNIQQEEALIKKQAQQLKQKDLLIREKDEQIRQRDERLEEVCHELQYTYNSCSYRIGRVISLPVTLAKKIFTRNNKERG